MEKTPSEDLNNGNLKYYIPGHVNLKFRSLVHGQQTY